MRLRTNKEIQPALSRLDLGNINVEVAEWVGFKSFLCELVAINLGQSTDAVTLQATVQGGSAKVWNRQLKRITTVVQRQPNGRDDLLPDISVN